MPAGWLSKRIVGGQLAYPHGIDADALADLPDLVGVKFNCGLFNGSAVNPEFCVGEIFQVLDSVPGASARVFIALMSLVRSVAGFQPFSGVG